MNNQYILRLPLLLTPQLSISLGILGYDAVLGRTPVVSATCERTALNRHLFGADTKTSACCIALKRRICYMDRTIS